ncbi:TolC family outer membrane protein [Marinobacterium marinum]|uniref:TolC family outer membrane protein n=1 Tax=Marinobacterium marinum TaxID=2756129 RepID=A0A7W2ABB6_9GAMM|nr:TolC family outer membrane protein [Marinobacterium marinum]MBA4502781.1 TolC family outer membrane protein [Marinobacterium marinum]
MDAVKVCLKPARLAQSIATGLVLLFGTQASAESLQSVVAEALDSNPEVRFEAEALNVLQAEKRKERGGYLPSVDLDVSVGQARRDFDKRGSYDRNYAELSITQMLFDGFKVQGRVDEAEHQMREQYYRLRGEAEDKTLEVAQAYLDVKRYRYLAGLAQANVDNHVRVRKQVHERTERGVGNRADLYQAEGRLALARSNLRTELSNLQSVTARFQRLVGRAPGESLQAVPELDAGMPTALEPVLNSAFANNPSIHAAFANIDAARSALTVAESTNYPTLELGLSHGMYQNNNGFDNRTDPDSYGDESLVELRMRYNIFNGGSDRATQRAAHHRIGQAESMRDKACVDLRQTATIAWAEQGNLKQKLTLLQQHKESSSNVVEAYRQQYDIGRRSLLDVLDSENEAFQAERSYVQGQYDLMLTRLQVLNSMGSLLDTLDMAPAMADITDIVPEGQDAQDLPVQYCAAVSDALVQLDVR